MSKKNQDQNSKQYAPAGYFEDDSNEFDCDTDDSFEICVRKTSQNMKITIVPDITQSAGLNGQAFDATLEPQLQTWFEQFKQIWNIYKKGTTVTHTLKSFFESCSNPYLYGLKLFANCPDFENPKQSSLSYIIMEELQKFKKMTNIGKCMDENLKMIAFNFVKNQGQVNLFKIVTNIFDLMESKTIFIQNIREMIGQHHYKEACQIATELKLFQEFSLYELVLPLLLQDKITIAEEHLNGAEHLRRPLIELLDTFLDRRCSVIANCESYIAKYNYTDVRLNKLHPKPLTKLIVRLVKMYDLPKEIIPNVNKMQNYGALQFLLHKKYIEKSLNKDSWDEMVKATVPQNIPELHIELITACAVYRDLSEAVKWTEYFNVEIKETPYIVQEFIQQNSSEFVENAVPEIENWDDDDDDECSNYNDVTHTLNLNAVELFLVDEQAKFSEMLNYLKAQSLIAFDSEWKPTFSTTNEVALIQLSTRNRVYLIDVICLNISNDEWSCLGKIVFNNDEVLKLGFAPSTDLSMFQKTIPALNLSQVTHQSTSYLDLQELWRRLNTISNFRFPFQNNEISNENLSNLVNLCLGKKLDKSNQFSNWEKRPLRKDQMNYAALDAYCLIEIYDVIENAVSQIGIDFKEFVINFLMETKCKITVKRKEKTALSTGSQPITQNIMQKVPPGPNGMPVCVNEIKFVCDAMLEGLAKALRRCGIDTVAMRDRNCFNDCVQLYLRENRFILTRGSQYGRFVQHIPVNHCYQVLSNNIDEQMTEVLKYFNVIVTETNIFSRCQICNCGEFLMASRKDILELRDEAIQDNMQDVASASVQASAANRTWIINQISPSAKTEKVTSQGAYIQASIIPRPVIDLIDVFYVCEGCGKCYWDGSHLDNILTGAMKSILNINQQ